MTKETSLQFTPTILAKLLAYPTTQFKGPVKLKGPFDLIEEVTRGPRFELRDVNNNLIMSFTSKDECQNWVDETNSALIEEEKCPHLF